MSRLKVFTNFANRMYKKVVGEKERPTQPTHEETRENEGSYCKIDSSLHAENPRVTAKSQKSTLIDDIHKIRANFQLYDGAKDRIRLHDGGIKDENSGYTGKERKTMKALAAQITEQLEQKGWTKYFEAKTSYYDLENMMKEDKSMPKDVRKELIKLWKDYGSSFQYFKKELQKEEFKLEEEPSNMHSFQ